MKKGKFELFSYFIKDNLIFYRSQNNFEKYIAFSIILIEKIVPIFSKLIHFLNLRLLDSFTYQIQKKSKDLLIICFKDKDKSNILKCFNIIYEKCLNISNINILKDNRLEDFFFNSIINPLEPKLTLEKKSNSLLIKNKEFENKISCFSLDLIPIKEHKKIFIKNLQNIIKNLNQKGLFLFHFRLEKNSIVFNPIFIEILNGDLQKPLFYERINTLFDSQILKTYPLDIKDFGSLIWRLPINENFYYLKEYSELFNKKKNEDCSFKIEEKFIKNNVKFIKINNKMFLIGNQILLLIISNINPIFIKKIIEKYYNKYFLLIVFLKQKEYLNLKKEINDINSLKNLKIMNKEEFEKIDYKFENFNKN
ncbi:MAG: hypothetical protein EU547_00070 [Promethearchaeota archaeon]|nr:MAG: hypothetical protein EU547_00070 [Candidatus Lokiarchaeota archaeon]